MRTLSFIIPEEYDGKTVQAYLRGEAKISLALLRSLKRGERGIELNGNHARSIDKIKKGDVLTVNIPNRNSAVNRTDTKPEILYEDEDILAVYKDGETPIHESHNHQGDTLQNIVSTYLEKEGKDPGFRAIGRLDKGTSGIVVCALNKYAASRLSGKVEKEYTALVKGVYTEGGKIDKPIYRPDPMKTIRTADDRGERAVTHYEPLKVKDGVTLMRIRLETGRTHQIRVHFAYLGTPLLGDRMYGEKDERYPGQCLHCRKVRFTHPVTGEVISLEKEAPFEKEFE